MAPSAALSVKRSSFYAVACFSSGSVLVRHLELFRTGTNVTYLSIEQVTRCLLDCINTETGKDLFASYLRFLTVIDNPPTSVKPYQPTFSLPVYPEHTDLCLIHKLDQLGCHRCWCNTTVFLCGQILACAQAHHVLKHTSYKATFLTSIPALLQLTSLQ